ncbi:MAG TPA: hypothetical protein VGG34_10320 [Opitutaceae bacterium]|jgi:hypothetical protein
MFTRKDRHGVLINLTDHCVQLARLSRLDERPITIDTFAEVSISDTGSVARWLDVNFGDRTGKFVSAYCGFHPSERIFQRDAINVRRLGERDFLYNAVAEQAKIVSAKAWHVAALNPSDGVPLNSESTSRTALFMGVPWAAAREAQTRLRDWGVRPRRLEVGTPVLLGGLNRYAALTGYPHLIAACEIYRNQTHLYLIGKDGVHTPPPLPHGLLSIEEAAMKELSAPDATAARKLLEQPTDELKHHGRRLIRMLSRHLRPAVDYFEMQTGQRIGALFCAHLPERLAWLEETLAAAVDLEYFSPDYAQWLPAVGLEAPGHALLGPSWIQPLSLVAELAPAAAATA